LTERYTPPLLTEGYMSPSPQLQQYLQSNEEEPYYVLKTNNPFFFWGVPDGYDPDHFMPWVYPFTSMIAGPKLVEIPQ
jgi:hypothetical protein